MLKQELLYINKWFVNQDHLHGCREENRQYDDLKRETTELLIYLCRLNNLIIKGQFL